MSINHKAVKDWCIYSKEYSSTARAYLDLDTKLKKAIEELENYKNELDNCRKAIAWHQTQKS